MGFENFYNEFLKLENDREFHEEVKDLIKKRLLLDYHQKKSSWSLTFSLTNIQNNTL